MDMSLCVRCKGKNLCGEKSCIILDKFRSLQFIAKEFKQDLFASSPPSVFVGRYGYPFVNVGTLAPPIEGETSIYDAPSTWFEKQMKIDEIFNLRTSLINSRIKRSIFSRDKFLGQIQEIAISKKSLDVEIHYKKPIKVEVSVYDRAAPIGPVGELERLKICDNVSVSRKVDSVLNDELKAVESINYLYEHKIDENKLQKILSVGLFGLETNKKIVPTRWSITAVDDIIGKHLINEIKEYDFINEILLFSATFLGNHFEILLLPKEWSFENIEVWLPKNVWNPTSKQALAQDYENYYGRKSYAANITGAYYACRLAALEYLKEIKRQASVLILREISSDYNVPLGVWVIRETARGALRNKPVKFNTLHEALDSVGKRMAVPIETYKQKSWLLKEYKVQKSLKQFA